MKKTYVKKESAQTIAKKNIKAMLKNFFEENNFPVIDCGEYQVEGLTKFTLLVRDETADVRVSIVSSPDKKPARFEVMDDILNGSDDEQETE